MEGFPRSGKSDRLLGVNLIIIGYNSFSLILASSVVKRQSILASVSCPLFLVPLKEPPDKDTCDVR